MSGNDENQVGTMEVVQSISSASETNDGEDEDDKVASIDDKASEAHKNSKAGDAEEDKDSKSKDDDIFLTEAGHILADAINLFSKHIALNENR